MEGGDETAEARIDEVRRIVGADDEATYGLGTDVPELDARSGYARWAATYDRPGNPLISVEQPAVWGLIDALPAGRTLDAACGTGRHAAHLAELLGAKPPRHLPRLPPPSPHLKPTRKKSATP